MGIIKVISFDTLFKREEVKPMTREETIKMLTKYVIKEKAVSIVDKYPPYRFKYFTSFIVFNNIKLY